MLTKKKSRTHTQTHTHCANEPRNPFCAHIQADRDDACWKRGKWEWDDNWTNSVDMYHCLSFGRSASRVCVHVCRTVTTNNNQKNSHPYLICFAIHCYKSRENRRKKKEEKYENLPVDVRARHRNWIVSMSVYFLFLLCFRVNGATGTNCLCECVRTCCDCCARAVHTHSEISELSFSLRFASLFRVFFFFSHSFFCRFSGCAGLCLLQFT